VQIQLNTDRNIEGSDRLQVQVEEAVTGALGRFGDRITRVEVHLTDVNANKGGRDTRCVMEARIGGMQPVTVDDLSRTVDQAIRAAAGKLERALETRLGKLGRH